VSEEKRSRGQGSFSEPRFPLRARRPPGRVRQRRWWANRRENSRQGLGRPQPLDPSLPGGQPLLEASSRLPPRVLAQRAGRRAREDRQPRPLPSRPRAGSVHRHHAAARLTPAPPSTGTGGCERRREIQVRRGHSLGSGA